MNGRLWLSNLDPGVTEEQLSILFGQFGVVEEIVIHDEPSLSQQTISALVVMADQGDAAKAVDDLDGYQLTRRCMRVGWFDDDLLDYGDDEDPEPLDFGDYQWEDAVWREDDEDDRPRPMSKQSPSEET